MDLSKAIRNKIKEIKKERKDAIYGAEMGGSMNPEYSADAGKYDYTIRKLTELLIEIT